MYFTIRIPALRPLVFALAATLTLQACSTRPLPETFAKLNTFDIVQKIRCETADSVKAFLRGYVLQFAKPTGLALRQGTLGYADFVKQVENDAVDHTAYIEQRTAAGAAPEQIEEELKQFRETILRYDNAKIAYDFTFDITENNNFSAGTNLLDLMTGGVFKLGISAENNNERKNTRNFIVEDSFKTMLSDGRIPAECGMPESGYGFPSYPIVGEIGMDEVFFTFFNLDHYANLTSADQKARSLSDTLQFTTTLKGTIAPKIELDTGVTNIRLADASIGTTIARVDVHKLRLVVAAPVKAPPPNATAQEIEDLAETLRTFLVNEIKRQRTNQFEENAALVVVQ